MHLFFQLQKSQIDTKRLAIKVAALSNRCFEIVEELFAEHPKLKAFKFQPLQKLNEAETFRCLRVFVSEGHEAFTKACGMTKQKKEQRKVCTYMILHFKLLEIL